MRRTFLAAFVGATALTLGLAVTASAASQPNSSPAARFARSVLFLEARGQYNREWSLLHPTHQRLISRARYAACLMKNRPKRIDTINVLSVNDTTVTYEAIPQHQVKSVTLDVFYRGGGRATFTMSAVPVAGAFRWVLSPGAAYRAKYGACPYA